MKITKKELPKLEDKISLQPVKVEQVAVASINPRLEPLPINNQQAALFNKHTNRSVYMSRKTALSMVKSDPAKFEIID